MSRHRLMSAGGVKYKVTIDPGSYWTERNHNYGEEYRAFECNVYASSSSNRVTRALRINFSGTCKITVYIQNYNFQNTYADNDSYGMIGLKNAELGTNVVYTSSSYVDVHTRGINSTTSTDISTFTSKELLISNESGFVDIGAKLYSYSGYVRCLIKIEPLDPTWYSLERIYDYIYTSGFRNNVYMDNTYNPDPEKFDCYLITGTSSVGGGLVGLRLILNGSKRCEVYYANVDKSVPIYIGKTGESLVFNSNTVSNYRYYNRTKTSVFNIDSYECASVFSDKEGDFVDIGVITASKSNACCILIPKKRPEQFTFGVKNVASYSSYPISLKEDNSCNPAPNYFWSFKVYSTASSQSAEILRFTFTGSTTVYFKSANSRYNVRLSDANKQMSMSGAGVTGHSLSGSKVSTGCTVGDFQSKDYVGDTYTVDIGYLSYGTSNTSHILIPKNPYSQWYGLTASNSNSESRIYVDNSCNPDITNYNGYKIMPGSSFLSDATLYTFNFPNCNHVTIMAKSENNTYAKLRVSSPNSKITVSGTSVSGYSYSTTKSNISCVTSSYESFDIWSDTTGFTIDVSYEGYSSPCWLLVPRRNPGISEKPKGSLSVSGWSSYTGAPSGYTGYKTSAIDGGCTTATITITGLPDFKCYIRSYAESNYDYVCISKLDTQFSGCPSSSSTAVKEHTSGNQQSGTSISSYTEVSYPNDGGTHKIYVSYIKDSYGASGDDTGYLLIPNV